MIGQRPISNARISSQQDHVYLQPLTIHVTLESLPLTPLPAVHQNQTLSAYGQIDVYRRLRRPLLYSPLQNQRFNLFDMVIRRLSHNLHIVHMRFAHARCGDFDKRAFACSSEIVRHPQYPMLARTPPASWNRIAATPPLYGTRPSMPSGTSLSICASSS